MSQGRADVRADGGFTIVELVVSMTVLAVLVGIAVPTFMAASSRASEARATTNLRTASKAAWVYVVQHPEGFADDVGALAELADVEPALDWVAGTVSSGGVGTVSVAEDSGGAELALAVRSTTGTCTYLRLSLVTVESQHTDESVTDCRAVDYVDGPNTGW